MENQKKLKHFSAGMLRWLLSGEPSGNIANEVVNRCNLLVEETEQLDEIPSETGRKKQALLEVVPGAAMFWLGLYTGLFWLIPGAALGVAGSYLISDSIGKIFSAGKEARFFRTLVYYLLRMENADGVISDAELANLKAIIEFIPAAAKEKEKWLKAIETPNGYLELAPESDLTQSEKEKVLSACWSLALCDGIDPSEEEMFHKFCNELNIDQGALQLIKVNVEKSFAQHSTALWNTIAFALYLYPELKSCTNKVYEIVALVALESLSQDDFTKRLKELPENTDSLKETAGKKYAVTTAAATLAISAMNFNNDKDHTVISEKIYKLTSKQVYVNFYADSLDALVKSLEFLKQQKNEC